MNRVRRRRIKEVIDGISDLTSILEEVLNDENECYDNLPENLQCSSRGEAAEECICVLEESIESFEEISSNLELL